MPVPGSGAFEVLGASAVTVTVAGVAEGVLASGVCDCGAAEVHAVTAVQSSAARANAAGLLNEDVRIRSPLVASGDRHAVVDPPRWIRSCAGCPALQHVQSQR